MARPRTASLEPEEMIKLGEEMIEWVIENKPIHLSMWYTQHKDITDKDWDAMRQIPEFLHYYNKALKLVGYAYLDKDSKVDTRLKDRWQRVYFKDLKKQEDQDASEENKRKMDILQFMQSLKEKEVENLSEDLQKQFDSLMSQISKSQSRS